MNSASGSFMILWPVLALIPQASNPDSRDLISESDKPLILITFRGEEAPEEMLTFFFATRNVSASKDKTASLAFPFSGFAVTRIFKDSPNHPAI